MEKYENKSIVDIFIKIEDIITKLANNYCFSIYIEISTTDGSETTLELLSNEKNEIDISNNIIIYKNVAISLNDIVKINIRADELIKGRIMNGLKNIDIYNSKYLYNSNYQRRGGKRPRDKNIEDYIYDNSKNIESIRLNSNIGKEKKSTLAENSELSLDLHKTKVLKNTSVSSQSREVVNSIDIYYQDVVTEIDIEKINVLTDKAKEVEVAKPIKTKTLNVVTDINIENQDIMINKSSTNAVKDITTNECDVISDVYPIYTHDVIGNINYNDQIIKPKTIDILCIEPVNKYVDKEDINSKPLRLDPTGEMYIGVILDDGTFEPLQISKKTLSILDSNVENLLGNIQFENNISQVVKDINKSKETSIKTLDVEYVNNLVECRSENIKNIKDLISIKNEQLNTVVNAEETVHVISKETTEEITNIGNIKNESIKQIKYINSGSAIQSLNIENDFSSVIGDASINTSNEDLENDTVDTIDKDGSLSKDDIIGNIEYVGNGIMIVDNEDSCITIYPTSKISSVNI
ncbi:hypothetical protein [Romboutsia lituseburensis]|uniref:hypothetical protein n=1 Tax=Romboutsia lituseburensis TaxID=1537 RepID=UPI00215B4DA1|nr:hypothetical protein [Romboutsia lituseburensis]MCR8744519.1 hypothetical protein [Romboutsia lituseburensis]